MDEYCAIFVERENDWLSSTRPTIVQELRQALDNKPLPVDSDEVLETVWMTLRERICNDWRLCDKILSGDAGLLLGLLRFLLPATLPTGSSAVITAVILGWRLGPEWMCKCSKRKKSEAR